MDWFYTYLAQYINRWRSLVNTVLNLLIIRFVIPVMFIIKLNWGVCTNLTQLI